MTAAHIADLLKHTEFRPLARVTRSAPIGPVDRELAHLLHMPPKGLSESVTYTYEGPHPVRIPLIATDGTKLGEFGDLDKDNLTLFTKIRATDSNNVTITSWTLQTFTFSAGWRTYDAKEGFHLALLNGAMAPILDFRIPSNDVDISCGDNGRRRFATSTFQPDLYDVIAGAWIYVPGGVMFHHC